MAEAAKPRPAARGRAPRPFWREALAAFWSGVAEPSGLALGTFLAALAAMLALCLWFFSEETLAGPWGRFLPRSPLDAEAFATIEALRAGHRAPDRPRLILLGTSTVAQAAGSGRDLAAMLRQATGQDWQVVILATAAQSPLDQFALAERALESQGPDSPPAVVALGFGLPRLHWTLDDMVKDAEHPRIGLRSEWADDELRAMGGEPEPQTGFYPFDNRDFLLLNGAKSLLRLMLDQPSARQVDQYARPLSDTPLSEIRRMMGARARASEGLIPGYLAQTARLAARVGAMPGARLVLIEEPLSPGIVAQEGLAPLHERLMAARATDPGTAALPFWPVTTQAGLTEADYFDDLHMKTGPAQTAVQRAIAADLAALLAAGGTGGTGNGG